MTRLSTPAPTSSRARQLARRAHRSRRYASSTGRFTSAAPASPVAAINLRLAEARGALGHARTRVAAHEQLVARLESALRRAKGQA